MKRMTRVLPKWSMALGVEIASDSRAERRLTGSLYGKRPRAQMTHELVSSHSSLLFLAGVRIPWRQPQALAL